jgi:hypothetical protein
MMDNEGQSLRTYRKVLGILEANFRLLMHAGASKDVLETYSQILKHLKDVHFNQISGGAKGAQSKPKRQKEIVSEEEIVNASLDEIERLVEDKDAPRKLLEIIAVARFNVPRGSLRSFSNMGLLRDRILTHIRNERVHQTISSVARERR